MLLACAKEKVSKMNYEEMFTANKELNEKEISEGRIVLRSKPRKLVVILTTECNLKCIMCWRIQYSSNFTPGVLEKIEILFPYLENIFWQGGEVFMVDFFKKILLKASKYPRILQTIQTNGLLIDDEWAGILSQNNIALYYSIDAVTKKTYEYIRRGGRFEDLIKSIETVNRHTQKHNNRVSLMINAVVMRSNYKELDLFPKFCKVYNFKSLRFEYVRPDTCFHEDIFTVNKDIEALKYLRDTMPRIKERCAMLGIEVESCLEPYLNLNEDGLNTERPDMQVSSDSIICKLPWKQLLIDTGIGGIRPDCLCPRSVGSICDSTIEKLWNNKIMQNYRKNIVNRTMGGWCSEDCLINAMPPYQREGL